MHTNHIGTVFENFEQYKKTSILTPRLSLYLSGSIVLSPTYATAAKCITASNAFSENILFT
jgi:hypothetical protein